MCRPSPPMTRKSRSAGKLPTGSSGGRRRAHGLSRVRFEQRLRLSGGPRAVVHDQNRYTFTFNRCQSCRRRSTSSSVTAVNRRRRIGALGNRRRPPAVQYHEQDPDRRRVTIGWIALEYAASLRQRRRGTRPSPPARCRRPRRPSCPGDSGPHLDRGDRDRGHQAIDLRQVKLTEGNKPLYQTDRLDPR